MTCAICGAPLSGHELVTDPSGFSPSGRHESTCRRCHNRLRADVFTPQHSPLSLEDVVAIEPEPVCRCNDPESVWCPAHQRETFTVL